MIKVQNISKIYKRNISENLIKKYFNPKFEEVKAVDSISFEISKGESVAFLGPNGAGKTTTIKMLTGILYPTSGEISVLGFKPFDRNKDFLMQIGIVMGNKSGLNWDLTPNQSFDLIKEIYKINNKDYKKRLSELSKVLRVEHVLNSQIRTLSLGERMKVEVIGAILHMPKILFLDEPTIGLDVDSKQNMRKFLRDLNKNYGITLMLTSHDMDDIENVSDRVVIINKGQVVYDDSIEELFNKFGSKKVVEIIFKSEEDTKSFSSKYKDSEVNGIRIKMEMEKRSVPSFISEATTKFDVDDIDIQSIKLEKIIQRIFNG